MTEEQIQKVIETVNSSGWKEVMEPAYAQRARTALAAVALDPEERKASGGEFKDLGDAQLRAIIRECEWMLGVWRNQITVYHRNRARDELVERQNGADSPLIPAANP
jgi:hypothetical protein